MVSAPVLFSSKAIQLNTLFYYEIGQSVTITRIKMVEHAQ